MKKRTKYRSRKVIVDGIVFDSKKEAKRWKDLCFLKKTGAISDLSRQVKFVLIPSQRENGKVIERECAYYADFVYVDNVTGKTVVEDVKGYREGQAYALFVLKRKLMLERYGIIIQEI